MLMSRSAKTDRAFHKMPGPSCSEKTMDVLNAPGVAAATTSGSRASTTKRVMLSLASWMPSSRTSSPYSCPARRLAMAATSLGTEGQATRSDRQILSRAGRGLKDGTSRAPPSCQHGRWHPRHHQAAGWALGHPRKILTQRKEKLFSCQRSWKSENNFHRGDCCTPSPHLVSTDTPSKHLPVWCQRHGACSLPHRLSIQLVVCVCLWSACACVQTPTVVSV
jgi:hypothetical protein